MRPKHNAAELVADWLDPFKVANAEQLIVRQEIAALIRLQASIEQ
jgi:hypothetical protein